ncbi:hypothetical protein CR513_32116, partial [Mucuna pruriens]
MADAICRWGPWSVEVLPCRSDEIIYEWTAETKDPFFYLYETLFSKLSIRLPFTDFKQVALQALNDIATMRARSSRSTTPSVAEASPLAAARLIEEKT